MQRKHFLPCFLRQLGSLPKFFKFFKSPICAMSPSQSFCKALGHGSATRSFTDHLQDESADVRFAAWEIQRLLDDRFVLLLPDSVGKRERDAPRTQIKDSTRSLRLFRSSRSLWLS